MAFAFILPLLHLMEAFESVHFGADGLYEIRNVLTNFPWLMPAALFAATWTYFSWVTKTRKRMRLFSAITLLLFVIISSSLMFAFFLPLFENFK